MGSGRRRGKPPTTEGHGLSEASEPVPEAVVERAKAAFSHRANGELAELLGDSLVDDSGSPADHLLQFEHAAMRINVQVSRSASTVELRGTVQPPSALFVLLEAEGADTEQVVDAPAGTFSFERVPHGVVRLHLISDDRENPIYTDWFRV
jgi:hypothetical protein